ncbi:uncharacterized protein AMSG_09821 [Thecamonas trahens ATCC 50062]|uniref:Uncharacterized protein n=1 Tax=Thecamonas trahens ATCC 50062 TaxID=461836 RepID=A0A0L0DNI1_THETB|nr:hypothetical protein AMSG_09821 [Thecamonas trahens ATCC 50062]KNC53869.1 hypothetical protein AMSG_09821 [Thecamonas trahens ATCC 50062]|eukprot:XP_013754249.1 hypothetical protein AMSG_09821 [Thecamonas trahens ATCC 50062]
MAETSPNESRLFQQAKPLCVQLVSPTTPAAAAADALAALATAVKASRAEEVDRLAGYLVVPLLAVWDRETPTTRMAVRTTAEVIAKATDLALLPNVLISLARRISAAWAVFASAEKPDPAAVARVDEARLAPELRLIVAILAPQLRQALPEAADGETEDVLASLDAASAAARARNWSDDPDHGQLVGSDMGRALVGHLVFAALLLARHHPAIHIRAAAVDVIAAAGLRFCGHPSMLLAVLPGVLSGLTHVASGETTEASRVKARALVTFAVYVDAVFGAAPPPPPTPASPAARLAAAVAQQEVTSEAELRNAQSKTAAKIIALYERLAKFCAMHPKARVRLGFLDVVAVLLRTPAFSLALASVVEWAVLLAHEDDLPGARMVGVKAGALVAAHVDLSSRPVLRALQSAFHGLVVTLPRGLSHGSSDTSKRASLVALRGFLLTLGDAALASLLDDLPRVVTALRSLTQIEVSRAQLSEIGPGALAELADTAASYGFASFTHPGIVPALRSVLAALASAVPPLVILNALLDPVGRDLATADSGSLWLLAETVSALPDSALASAGLGRTVVGPASDALARLTLSAKPLVCALVLDVIAACVLRLASTEMGLFLRDHLFVAVAAAGSPHALVARGCWRHRGNADYLVDGVCAALRAAVIDPGSESNACAHLALRVLDGMLVYVDADAVAYVDEVVDVVLELLSMTQSRYGARMDAAAAALSSPLVLFRALLALARTLPCPTPPTLPSPSLPTDGVSPNVFSATFALLKSAVARTARAPSADGGPTPMAEIELFFKSYHQRKAEEDELGELAHVDDDGSSARDVHAEKEEEKPPLSREAALAAAMLGVCPHFLAWPQLALRSAVLDTAAVCFPVIRWDASGRGEDTALPLIHAVWGPLMAACHAADREWSQDPLAAASAMTSVVKALSSMVRVGRSFMRRRVVTEAWPVLAGFVARLPPSPAAVWPGARHRLATAFLAFVAGDLPLLEIQFTSQQALGMLDSMLALSRALATHEAEASEDALAALAHLAPDLAWVRSEQAAGGREHRPSQAGEALGLQTVMMSTTPAW